MERNVDSNPRDCQLQAHVIYLSSKFSEGRWNVISVKHRMESTTVDMCDILLEC